MRMGYFERSFVGMCCLFTVSACDAFQREFRIDVPEAPVFSATEESAFIKLRIDASNKVFLEGESIDMSELSAALAEQISDEQSPQAAISAHPNSKIRDLIRVRDITEALGIEIAYIDLSP